MRGFRVFAGPRALLGDVLYESFVRTNTNSKDPTRLGMETMRLEAVCGCPQSGIFCEFISARLVVF